MKKKQQRETCTAAGDNTSMEAAESSINSHLKTVFNISIYLVKHAE